MDAEDGDKFNYLVPITDLLPVATDGPSRKLSLTGGDNFFNRLSVASTLRSSARSSLTSIDQSGTVNIAFSFVPHDESSLFQLVQNLTDQYKKTSHLKEVLSLIQWLSLNPNLHFGSNGVTLLHAAASLDKYKLVAAFGHCQFGTDLDPPDSDGNTPMHIAANLNHPHVIEALLKVGSQGIGKCNLKGRTPLQVAASKCHLECLSMMVNFARTNDPDHDRQRLVDFLWDKTGSSNETLLHLACRYILIKYLNLKDDQTRMLESGSGWDEPDNASIESDNYFSQIENKFKLEETRLREITFPTLEFLLDVFAHRPELVEEEDTLATSPGLIMHYFASFNYVRGVEILLNDVFSVKPNTLNKHCVSPLWIAAKHNFLDLGLALLEFNPDPQFQADPNACDPISKMTPLHLAVYGYHSDRVDETCRFIESLLKHGADPRKADRSGETAPHLAVVKTRDFRIMSKFIDHLGMEALDVPDDNGNTLFHYAAGCLDDSAILKLLEKGAPLMKKNLVEVPIEEAYGCTPDAEMFTTVDESISDDEVTMPLARTRALDGDMSNHFKMRRFQPRVEKKRIVYKRVRSVTAQRLPLQEAIKNGNSNNYFNALRRVDFKSLKSKMSDLEFHEFVCTHLLAATREVRPDVVRILFQQVTGDSKNLHRVLLYNDVTNPDPMFSKTALEWAVENNDRLCTTEILHQEFECHKDNKGEGLSCLRRQLTGDELLMWTIETFTLFYERTWAQRFVFPFFGLLPLFLSISSFVYDYYSDLELTFEYYRGAFHPDTPFANDTMSNDSSLLISDDNNFFDCNQLLHLNSTHIVLPIDDLTSGKFQNLQYQNCTKQLAQILEYRTLASSNLECADIVREAKEYRTAFIVNLICIAVPLVIFYVMCARELLIWLRKLENRCKNQIKNTYLFLFAKALGRILWICPVSVLCAPFFILYIAIRQVYFKFHHNRAKRKNKFRRQLQKSEYLWGISRTAEAGLESCGQLILQVWLLSSDFNSLSKDTFADIVDKTYNGIIFFLSFSIKPADDIEKSLGKMFMSFVALVFGVSACYRTLKRGAVGFSNTAFIYLSLLLQIFARIFSIGLYYFAVRSFLPATPILLFVHFFFVFIIKWSFERSKFNSGMLSHLVGVINIFANSLVYVRIVPIEKSLEIKQKKKEHQNKFQGNHNVESHSTFLVQTLFFALVLVENLFLASTPLFFNGKYNRAYACLGQEKLLEYVFIVFCLCVGSWIFHIGYYKYMGHPWSEINGPQCENRDGIKFRFYGYGKEREFNWSCIPVEGSNCLVTTIEPGEEDEQLQEPYCPAGLI